jgi:hypothetical protein
VPVNFVVNGLRKSAAVVLMLPDWIPVAVGVNVTVKVQLEFPKILDPQLLVCLNGPLIAPFPKFTAVEVTFVMVNVKG